MVKTYTSQDNTFEGTITFDKDVDMNFNNITSVDTPIYTNDLANKSYVDGENPHVITTQAVDTFSNEHESSITNIASCAVSVSTGQQVLLLFHGYSENLDDNHDIDLWFRRSSTDLNNDDSCIRTENDDSSAIWGCLPMSYLDTTPGTGTITYYLRGITDDEYINGRFTALVMN